MSYAFPLHIDWHCLCGDSASSHVSKADSEECHGHCQRTDHDCRGFGYRPIDHSGRTPAISAIFQQAGRLRMPEHYTCDLSTDYQTLATYTGSFIWVVRPMGTHLYTLDNGLSGKDRTWQYSYVTNAVQYHENNADPRQRIYFWSAEHALLTEINYTLAREIARDHLSSARVTA